VQRLEYLDLHCSV